MLVSRATGVPLEVGEHAQIECRSGPLDEGGLTELIAVREIGAVVDATHPYATVIRTTARRVARQQGIPYLSLLRPAVVEAGNAGVEFAPDHAAAAVAAFAYGRPVLLSTGTETWPPMPMRRAGRDCRWWSACLTGPSRGRPAARRKSPTSGSSPAGARSRWKKIAGIFASSPSACW